MYTFYPRFSRTQFIHTISITLRTVLHFCPPRVICMERGFLFAGLFGLFVGLFLLNRGLALEKIKFWTGVFLGEAGTVEQGPRLGSCDGPGPREDSVLTICLPLRRRSEGARVGVMRGDDREAMRGGEGVP